MTDNRTLDELVEDFLHELDGWEGAYPLSAFPEPDLKRAAKLLKDGGMTLDAVSASNMRHVVSRIAPKAREAIATLRQKNEALREAVSFALKEIDTAFNVNVRIEIGKRLRASLGEWLVNPDGPEAADRIAQLEAALRETLTTIESATKGEYGFGDLWRKIDALLAQSAQVDGG